jgi:iron complex transport system ATP-binding protein
VSDEVSATDDGANDEADAEHPVVVRDLAVSYGDSTVVEGVDLTLEAGSLVGLVGPNGAGKTTVLRAIRGVVERDAGSVRLDGAPLETLSARAVGRRVASVPQETGLSFAFTVRAVVEMGRTPHRGRFEGPDASDADAVENALARTRTTAFADRPITELSGGERSRVLLARALAQETPALLLDEPTASLDVNRAAETMALLRRLVDDGRAAVAAIHDLEMAARYCDRVVVLANGRVRAAGPPDAVLDADTVHEAFDAEAFVGRAPATGGRAVTAYPSADAAAHRVHVAGVGPETARIVARLGAAGHDLSVGVVPAGDAAALAAADVDATVVSVPPFADVDESAQATAVELAECAAVVVAVTDGSGTLTGAIRERADLVVDTADPPTDETLLARVAAAAGSDA